MLSSRERRFVERLIEAPLPKSVKDLNYYKYQPSPNLYAHYVYIKFRASKEDYIDLMRRMGVPTYDKSYPQLRMFLPGEWRTHPSLTLEWWNPKMDIPDDTAMLNSGAEGWILAKHENSYVYIVIHRLVRSSSAP